MSTESVPVAIPASIGTPGQRPATETKVRLSSRLRLHPAFVVIVGACALLFHQAMHTGLAGDVYFHWAAGVWMLDHHSVIRHDVFSYTVAGRPWVADEWGFEVALAWLVRTIGSVTFWAVSAGTCSAALLLGVATWRRAGAGWLWTSVLACLASAGLLEGLAVRPQDPSYMFFAAELFVLSLARSDARWLATLPPLLLVWANVHGSFLLGLLLLALEVLWAVLPEMKGRLRVSARLPLKAAILSAVTSSAATLVNPHGFGLLAYDFHVSTSNELTSLIEEWQSPNFHNVLLLVLVVGPILWLIGTLGLSERRIALEDVVVSVALVLATLHAVRFVPYLALASCLVLSRATPFIKETIRPTLLTCPLAAVLAIALLAGSHVAAGTPLLGDSPGAMPVDAGAFLAHKTGRVFATYWWNDYLMHLGIPVFVDGRTDLYFGTGILRSYVDASTLTVNPDTVFRRWDVRYVMWNRDSALSVFLSSDPRWRLETIFGDAVVFAHVGTW